MKISVLIENKCYKANLVCEHGLSLLIKTDKDIILFDTGSSNNYVLNAEKLNINLDKVNYLVISHGHYDHMGGLNHFPKKNNLKKVFISSRAFLPKYKSDSNEYIYNGFPDKELAEHIKNNLEKTDSFYRINDSITLISSISHISNNDKYFIKDNGKMIVDDFGDEQILVIEENQELSIFMGCSHFGVIEGIEAVKAKFPNKKIKNLVAGMHLSSKSDIEINHIVLELNKYNIKNIIPLHCTGVNAICIMKKNLINNCYILSTGEEINL